MVCWIQYLLFTRPLIDNICACDLIAVTVYWFIFRWNLLPYSFALRSLESVWNKVLRVLERPGKGKGNVHLYSAVLRRQGHSLSTRSRTSACSHTAAHSSSLPFLNNGLLIRVLQVKSLKSGHWPPYYNVCGLTTITLQHNGSVILLKLKVRVTRYRQGMLWVYVNVLMAFLQFWIGLISAASECYRSCLVIWSRCWTVSAFTSKSVTTMPTCIQWRWESALRQNSQVRGVILI